MGLEDSLIHYRVNILKPLPVAHEVLRDLPISSPPTRPLAHSAPATLASSLFFKRQTCPHLRAFALAAYKPPHPTPCWNSLLSDLHMAPSLLPSTHICTQMSLFLSYHPLCPFPCFIFPHCVHHILCVYVFACVSFFSVCFFHQNVSSTRAEPVLCLAPHCTPMPTTLRGRHSRNTVNEHIRLYPLCYTPAQTPQTLPRQYL